MADKVEKVTRTKLDAQLREEVTEQITALFVADGLTPKKRAGGKLLFEKPDATGDDRWVEVDVIIPKGDRETGVFDGQALIDEYEDGLELTKEKARLREEASKAKQAKRAEKDKAKAEKAEADKAKAEAEAEGEPAE